MDKLKAYWRDFSRYLMEVWIEVRPQKGRVVWPTVDNIKLSTKVVIVSSLGIGVFIGVLDILFGEILKLIIGKGAI
ncbi:MAG: preprotein translocase subunit SecE [Candidatus Riflebacteria bacterium]|nr:preprotein translocase subunit SecE [Candidatus Riflebacteria bacterium]